MAQNGGPGASRLQSTISGNLKSYRSTGAGVHCALNHPSESKGGITMTLSPRSLGAFAFWIVALSVLVLPLEAGAQSCQTSSEIEESTRNAITTAAQRYFALAASGDSASLKQNSIPTLASDFGGIEATLKDNQANLAGAQGTVTKYFLLDASGAAPIPQAEFYCGVFGKNGQTANSAAFYLNNLPPGKYAAALLDATSAKGKTMFSEILQQMGTDWKLAGLYVKPAQIAGHDSNWFLTRGREFKAKGQLHNAFFYFEQARSLISPLPFMSTQQTDNLFDESQNLQPTDIPAGGKLADLPAGTVTYKLTAVFPQAVGEDLDLIVKYQSTNVSNTNLAYQDNVSVMKAFVAKFPEVRDAFAGVVARAVAGDGQDYGTLLAMKDIK
jgi:hypothetical protein